MLETQELCPVTSVDLGSVRVMSSSCRALKSELEVITQSCSDQGVIARLLAAGLCRVQVAVRPEFSTWRCLKALKSQETVRDSKGRSVCGMSA